MRRILVPLIVLLVLPAPAVTVADDASKQSAFLSDCLAWGDARFGGESSTKIIGYGTATYPVGAPSVDGTSIEWFCWSNSQGLVELLLSTPISPEAIAAIKKITDGAGAHWTAYVTKHGRSTWIGTSTEYLYPADGSPMLPRERIIERVFATLTTTLPITDVVSSAPTP